MKTIVLFTLIVTSIFFTHKEKWDDNKSDWTPLMMAIYTGNATKYSKLINNRVDVTYRIKTSWKLNSLDVAVKKSDFKAVTKLIATGKFSNLQPYFEDACGQKSQSVIDLFISKGAKINSYSKNGHSCLMTACSFGTYDIVKSLISNGAELDHQRKVDGITALMLAAFKGKVEEVELLLKNGADKTIKDKNGLTAYGYVDQIYPRLNIPEHIKDELKTLLK